MFFLTEQELDSSFSAICHHGYSTMLPEPLEWQCVKIEWPKVREAISKFDLDTYKPYKPMKIFAPKNRANIRVTHLLHPQDMIIYTALTMIIKNDIESSRVSKRAKRVFSYRVNQLKEDVLYDTKDAYNKYLKQLEEKASKGNVKFIGIADIADFFPRIYQHRLENAIESVANDQRGVDVARVLVKKLISHLMDGNSYGIPVGPYASRVLAEALLIDVDANLQSRGADFVRWVDDYNIFCKSEYEAQSNLFSLGEWLFSNHGLTLQSAKSKILTVERYKDEILPKPDNQLTKRGIAVKLLKKIRGNYDEEVDHDELDEATIKDFLHKLQSINLKQMLQTSISDKALVDYEMVTYVLSKLPRLPGASKALKKTVLDIVIENAELLYPVSEYISKYIIAYEGIDKKTKKMIASKLLKPLKSRKNPPPDYYAMWVLHIFSTSEDWNHVKTLTSLYQNSTSEIIKRYAALAVSIGGKRAEALAIKDDYTAASPLLRLGILAASKKLGKDERKHWKVACGVNGVVEKLI